MSHEDYRSKLNLHSRRGLNEDGCDVLKMNAVEVTFIGWILTGIGIYVISFQD
jgi:hypothetical protein